MPLKFMCHSLGKSITVCLLGKCWEISAYEQEPLTKVKVLCLENFREIKIQGQIHQFPFSLRIFLGERSVPSSY